MSELVVIEKPSSEVIVINDEKIIAVKEKQLEVVTIGIQGPEGIPGTDTESVINAKGDLIVGDENAEAVRLPIGLPNYFLVVDPTQDRGYKFTKELDGGTF